MLDVDPENIWGLFNKGKLLFEQQKYEQVIQVFDKFMNFQSRSFEPLLYRAISYLQTGQLENAKNDYKKLEELSPEPVYYVCYGLGEIAYREKDTATATKYYKKYLDVCPSQLKPTAEYKTVKSRYDEMTGRK
jgi:tetratricopeptide (TPR) repeat protein